VNELKKFPVMVDGLGETKGENETEDSKKK